jgi:hypothetical protein
LNIVNIKISTSAIFYVKIEVEKRLQPMLGLSERSVNFVKTTSREEGWKWQEQ